SLKFKVRAESHWFRMRACRKKPDEYPQPMSAAICPVFVGGEWSRPAKAPTLPVYNPSTGDVIAEAPLCDAKLVDQAVQAAAAAFPGWRDTPPVERARVFFRYRQLLEQNFDRICQSISREHGKTLAEARGSLFRGIENVEYACGIPSLLMGDTLDNIA